MTIRASNLPSEYRPIFDRNSDGQVDRGEFIVVASEWVGNDDRMAALCDRLAPAFAETQHVEREGYTFREAWRTDLFANPVVNLVGGLAMSAGAIGAGIFVGCLLASAPVAVIVLAVIAAGAAALGVIALILNLLHAFALMAFVEKAHFVPDPPQDLGYAQALDLRRLIQLHEAQAAPATLAALRPPQNNR
jgi:hypothetical protein